MEVTGDPPPLWPLLTTSAHRRRSPSPIFSLPVLIILLPILALLLLFLVVPPFLSVTAQILRPLGVRKSWDSLNVFLVLFAIICGVLARRNDDDEINNGNGIGIRNDSISDNSKASGHHVSQQWFDHPARKTYDDGAPINVRPSPATGVRRLKRSSSSYPDLRQDSLWENNEDRFRFFDDFEINKYRSSTSYDDQVHVLRRSWRSGFEESEAKVIPVDTFVLRSSPSSPPSKSPPPSTPPPPPPPPPAARQKPRRTYQAVGQSQKDHKVMNQNDRIDFNEIKSPSVTPPPPPPPPPRRSSSPLVQVGNRSEQKYGKLERRKSNATKEIKMVFASLRKRKKKHKSKDHDHQQDCPLHSPTEPPSYYSTSVRPTSPAPPPPPPPPPPSSVFQRYNLFRKGSKSKKIHSVPTPPPPPPTAAFSFSKGSSEQNTQIPTPPPATFYTKRLSKQKSQIPPPPPEPSRKQTTANNGKPPLPTKANTISYYYENVNSGGQSPLIPIPPPPPPFKMPDFKFVIRGDFVKIQSGPSSRCSSPDLEEIDVSSSKDETETGSITEGDGGAGVAGVHVYCPSPDVNAKAETFIARLRDGWKLEKINSIKEKQGI
ncbi:hypothetical protein V6N13_097975 [Hibiscus sabdariffa]|uniref:Hydroxyproline-rich glycoprotein family protein n=1 Tax=Hibiscus sabdariffa TaxID=183260 RepID=A0ABR2NVD3_9ROSI